MKKRELKEWWDSDEDETSWGESAAPLVVLMFVVIVLFIFIMTSIAP